jgi:hypothetical protein
MNSIATAESPTEPPMDAGRAAEIDPSDPLFAEAIARLASRDDEATWRELLAVLAPVARALGASFRDFTNEDDVLGDLALAAHERWIAAYVDRAQRAEARVPLVVFLRDRMRDQLREERRRRVRRAELLRGAPLSITVVADAPEAIVAANELRARATGGSAALDAVVRLREAGHDHREIAARTGSSPATVSRRLAAIAAVLVPLLAAAALAFWPRTRPVPTVSHEETVPSVTGTAPSTTAVAPTISPSPSPSPSASPSLSPTPPAQYSPPARATHTGRFVVNALPWCRIDIDGRAVGPTPQMITLPVGPHRVRCTTDSGEARQETVVISPDETTRLVFRFGE